MEHMLEKEKIAAMVAIFTIGAFLSFGCGPSSAATSLPTTWSGPVKPSTDEPEELVSIFDFVINWRQFKNKGVYVAGHFESGFGESDRLYTDLELSLIHI